MAKAVVTFTDNEDGKLDVELVFDPELTREKYEAGDVTEAQAVALLVMQDLVTDEIGRASSEKFDKEDTSGKEG